MTKGLSKSLYTDFCQCPKNLWLNEYRSDEAKKDKVQEARFEQGKEVGDLAKGLFGPYKEVTVKNPDESLGLTTMCALTQQYMNQGVDNICEASFVFEGHYCAVDILHRNGDGWDIYEVKKSGFSVNDKLTELERYAPDIAYQKWVLTQCGIKVTGTYMVCLNSDYVRHGDLDIKGLFFIKDVHDLVKNEYLKVPVQAAQALKIVNDGNEPDIDLSERCNKPYRCAFWDYCKQQHGIPTPSVFEVYGGSLKSKKEDRFFMPQKLELYRAGKISFEDIKNEPLGHIQRLQVEGREYINKEGIRQFLDKLTYPLYFLDFETMQDVLPQYDGAKPNQQITFQYSLHIKEKANAPYQHKEYLASSDGKDPRRALAEQLCKDIPMDVCTVAYNKEFECGRLKELAELCPDLAVHLLNIRDHIVDLIDPFRAGDYYVPAMGGSFSIKSVLPALFPDDPSLDYHKLSKLCQNGGEAMTLFPRIQHMPPDEAKAAREALLRYCELDTWAMVKVLEKLKEMANM